MTQRPAAVPSLPLSVTCSVDARFGHTIGALAARMATDTGGGAAAERFAEAVNHGVTACLDHLDEPQALTIELTANDTAWEGVLQWPARPAGDDAFMDALRERLAPVADEVECGHTGTGAFCCVRCSRG